MPNRRRLAGDQGVGVRLLPGEEGGVIDHPVLEHLGEPGAVFAPIHGRDQGRIDDHAHRLLEGADQVFPSRAVDAGLAAHRRIDHRQQRGRYLHEAHAAHPARGDIAGEIAADAAAEGDDGIAAVDAMGRAALPQEVGGGQRLARFAGGKGGEIGTHAGRGEGGGEARGVVTRDLFVGDDQHVVAAEMRARQFAGAIKQVRSDVDRVGVGAEVDGDGAVIGHGGCSRRLWTREARSLGLNPATAQRFALAAIKP